MALMKLKVTPIDGDAIDVSVTPKVIVAAERHFKRGMGELFSKDNSTYEALAFCAWQAMMASGHDTHASFDRWLDGIEEISADDEAIDTDPKATR